MALSQSELEQIITQYLGDKLQHISMEHDILTLTVESSVLEGFIKFLKEDSRLRFLFLTDLCGLHVPANPINKRIGVVYLLHNWVDNIRVRVKVFLPEEQPRIPTITHLFKAANWMERETYDFYGVHFEGHSNLKRILNHEGMKAFPMRKEYAVEDASRTDKDDRYFGRSIDPHSVADTPEHEPIRKHS